MATVIIPQGISVPLNSSGCCGCWTFRCLPSGPYCSGEQPLQQALQAQQTVLEQQAAHLAAAMQFCADLARQRPQAETLDVDACLTRMEKPAAQQVRSAPAGCRITARWHRCSTRGIFPLSRRAASTLRRSSQRPCRPTQKSTECSSALTKEGMYPEFSLDGISV